MSKEWINPIDLISPKRFDIMFKYTFAYLMEKGILTKWSIAPYEHHLKVWNNLVENQPRKDGIEEFISSFKDTLSSIKQNGFDTTLAPVPIAEKDRYPLNGAHRVAASLLYNKPVLCEELDAVSALSAGCSCSSSYLLNRREHVPTGLLRTYSDSAMHQYAKLKANTRIITVFPAAVGNHDELNKLISEECDVIYSASINLSHLGCFNFIRYVYDEDESRGNAWLGNASNGWPGAVSKTNLCFPNEHDRTIKMYWFEESSPDDSVILKDKIRSIFNIGKHSVHINDTHTETLSMTGYTLNAQGRHFLNTTQPRHICNFDNFFEKFKKWIKDSNLDSEDFCVDSSAVLTAYSLRDCRDLDFLYSGDFIETGMSDVSCHNEELKHYRHSKEEIIFNPQNHFYYKGIKFASLEVVRDMKEFRNEEKDVVDVGLINNLIKSA